MIRVKQKNADVPKYTGSDIGNRAVNGISVMFKNLNRAEKLQAKKIIEKYLATIN